MILLKALTVLILLPVALPVGLVVAFLYEGAYVCAEIFDDVVERFSRGK